MSDDAAGIYHFIGIGEVADTTIQLMALNMRHGVRSGSNLERVAQMILQQARDYLSQVREGFVLSVRSDQVLEAPELRYLLDRVLTDWEQLSQELGVEATPGGGDAQGGEPEESMVARVRSQLLAYGMAQVALGSLPRLPSTLITFPHSYGRPPTYADIPVPSSPAGILQRIEELEEMIWEMAAHDMERLIERRYGPVRRTYGFFETSAYLVRTEAKRFGFKTTRSSPPI